MSKEQFINTELMNVAVGMSLMGASEANITSALADIRTELADKYELVKNRPLITVKLAGGKLC